MALSCPECGVGVLEADAFCGECGANLAIAETLGSEVEEPEAPAGPEREQAGSLCSGCGRAISPGERFCAWCGTPASGVAPAGSPPPPVAQAPTGQGEAAADRVGAVLSQGGGEATERLQKAWGNPLVRPPLIFLGLLTLGFFLPVASVGITDAFGGSATLSDLTSVNAIFFLLISIGLLVLLVLHATSPDLGDAPALAVAAISFVFAVITTILATVVVGGAAAFDRFPETFDEGDFSVGLGTILLLVGAVGLFVTSIRLITRRSPQQ